MIQYIIILHHHIIISHIKSFKCNIIMNACNVGAVLIDCSTIDPITSKALNAIAKDDFGLNFYDCPVR